MIRVDQSRLHDPENGVYGNCYAACIASILCVPLERMSAFDDAYIAYCIPAEEGHHDFALRELFQRELLKLGCWPVRVNASDAEFFVGVTPRGFSIANGVSPRGVMHSCVALDGVITHDPHPSRGGIETTESYDVLVRVVV